MVLFKTMAGARGSRLQELRYLGQQAQITGEKAWWWEVEQGGRESLIFSFGEADIREEGCQEQAEKRPPLSWLSGVN